MNIKNFESIISKTILKRGLNYFRQGQVVSLLEYTNLKFQAEVEGTYNYSVTVNMNDKKEIIDSTCNCPFDWGNYCKHEAAVYYALREDLNNQDKKTKKENLTLQQLLKTKNKEELIQLILEVSSKNNRVYTQFLEADKKIKNSIESAEKIIHYHLDQAITNGAIKSSKVVVALEGLNLALDQVKLMLETSDFEKAVGFGLLSFKHGLKILSYADDSSGETKSVIERSLLSIEEATKEGVKKWNVQEKNIVFKEIINVATQKRIGEWSDSHFYLLKTTVYFCTNMKLKDQLKNVLESLLEQIISDSWEDKYFRGKLKELELTIISQTDDIKIFEEFLLANLSDSNIRNQAILHSLKKKDFQQVLQLKIDSEF